MCEVFIIIIIIIIITIILLIASFCTYLHMRFHIFNCLSYLILVFMIWIYFRRWSVLYEVFDSFTDLPYGNAFVFITYVKPFAIKL